MEKGLIFEKQPEKKWETLRFDDEYETIYEGTKKDFNLASELNKIQGPFIEMAGPSDQGYSSIDSSDFESLILNKKLFISNIHKGYPAWLDGNFASFEGQVDFQADARHLPIKKESAGAVFCSCLSYTCLDWEKNPNLISDEEANKLRAEAIKEAWEILRKGGLLIWQGGRKVDRQEALKLGFEVIQYIIKKIKMNKDDNNGENEMVDPDQSNRVTEFIVFRKP